MHQFIAFIRYKASWPGSSCQLGHSADGDQLPSGQNFGMQQGSGFLSTRQRRCAWLGFVLTAIQAPVSARLVDDGSWLFSVCVALMVATVILADDAMRRPATESRDTTE
jgi:hypothetical protein